MKNKTKEVETKNSVREAALEYLSFIAGDSALSANDYKKLLGYIARVWEVDSKAVRAEIDNYVI